MPSYYNNRAARFYPEDLEETEEVTRPARPTYRVAGGTTQPRIAQPVQPPAAPRPASLAPSRRPNVPVYERTNLPRRERVRVVSPLNGRWVIGMVLVVAVLVVSYLVGSALVNGWQTWQDDQTYGRPRLTRLETRVGHNEVGPNAHTLFLAQNLHGQISIIEIPGEDPAKTRVIVGPQLFGKDRDLVPIKLSTQDVNGDGQPDLIATVQEQKLIYINENGSFRPITEAERTKLQASTP